MRSKLLVVNDHHNFRKVIARMLGSEHEVLVVPSALDVLKRVARGERFDLLLCELIMPGMDGVAFHERLGSIAPEMLARVVFVTAGAVRRAQRVSRTSNRLLDREAVRIAEELSRSGPGSSGAHGEHHIAVTTFSRTKRNTMNAEISPNAASVPTGDGTA